jgi:arsenate reductase (thioredoxin)
MISPSTGCATSETIFKPALPLYYVTSTSDTKEPLMADKPSVLFVCVHNAGRSQMAAGYLNHFGGDRIEVRSAGSEPADKINPIAVQAMAEEGIDIAAEQPKILTTEAVKASDVVITMGCGDTCPFYPGKRYEDWVLDDPAGQDINHVRPIRDEIRRRVEQLISELQPVSSRSV